MVSDLVFLWVLFGCVCFSFLFHFIHQRSSCLPAPKREGAHHRTWPQSALCLPVCSLSIQRKGVELGGWETMMRIYRMKSSSVKIKPQTSVCQHLMKKVPTNEGTRQRRTSPKSRKDLNRGGLVEPRQFPLE